MNSIVSQKLYATVLLTDGLKFVSTRVATHQHYDEAMGYSIGKKRQALDSHDEQIQAKSRTCCASHGVLNLVIHVLP